MKVQLTICNGKISFQKVYELSDLGFESLKNLFEVADKRNKERNRIKDIKP